MIRLAITVLFTFLTYCAGSQIVDRLSVHRVSQALSKGKKVTTVADCYYDTRSYKFVVNAVKPEEFVKIINNKGELKLYFIRKNSLLVKQNSAFSSYNEVLHYFVNNLYDDLGLKREGFKISETKYDGDYMITTWLPPSGFKALEKVEIVYEKMVPVYCAYYSPKGEIIKKTYYSDYYQGSNLILPQRIMEVSYTAVNDSIVRRTIYSNIKFNEEVSDYYLNFKIPNDAKLVK